MRYKNLFIVLSIAFEAFADTTTTCTTSYCTDYVTNTGCNTLSTGCLAMNSTHHGTFLRYPDVCNCCDYCLTNLAEGEICVIGQPGQLPPAEICGPELVCTANDDGQATCQKMSTSCTLAQDAYDERSDNGTLGSTEVRPKCDEDGLYTQPHCIPGSICYCIAPTGERIFGEIPYLDSWNEQEMSCGCSLNAWKAQNTLDPKYPIPVARCLSNGQFDPLQCMNGTDAKCLCVNSITGSPRSGIDTVKVSELDEESPTCFDASIHTTGTYNATCELEYDTLVEEIKALIAEGTDVDIDLPICQEDGKYARVQSAGTNKICVDPSGVQINSYQALANSTEAEVMDCNCARTRWLLSEAGVSELPTCCDFGNFEAWQCRRAECFCVDENGNQIGLEVDILDLETLDCYITNNGDACLVS